jgi:murein DD-endopeptidase MepM/ murein hydrolase activator NlpD
LSRSDVSTKVVELLGGILPEEDGQELDTQEVQDIVERNASGSTSSDFVGDGSGAPLDGVASSGPAVPAQGSDASWQPKASTVDNLNTTDIYKTADAADEPSDDFEGGKVIVVSVGPKDTLAKILAKAGAPEWDVHSMIEAGHSIFPENGLAAGQEVRITLVPSLSDPNKMEPARYSIFSDGHEHLVTVSRSAAGEFVGTSKPPFEEQLQHVANGDEDPQNATLYAAVYLAGLTQHLAPETIQRILNINAYDTDFRRRVRPGDTLEMFFDMKDDQSTDGPPGELLYTAIASGGETYKFYRFRSADGVVDYYDEDGNNSKKFLIRKPVRGENVRLTSGFGIRFHPLLNTRKMHTGVDWACALGTPIIAAGNGTIEEEGHKGYYGNYIRIRHSNGYQTAYGHMSRFGKLHVGDKVRQGQIIGYVGSTGLSSGPHVHFEVLVNNRFVDPMSIQVPRERKLEGRDLAEFEKERAHIEELMRRAPVMTANK